MKKIPVILCFLLLALSLYGPVYACTSFAVYSRNTLYGMNFDYPDTELRFTISQNNTGNTFSLEFQQGYNYIPIAGMNSKGLFCAEQLLYPVGMSETRLENNEIVNTELGGLLRQYSKVSEIKNYLKNKKLVYWAVSVHHLFADKSGNAAVIEVGDKKNEIITGQKKFMVMSNFPMAQFAGKSYKDVNGSGADRYKMAYELIQNNFDKFNISAGWEVLGRIWQTDGYPTLCSMIFDPVNNNIYIALKRNMNKIWKVSLKEQVIEGFSGFNKPVKIKIKPQGVLASELMKK